MFKVEYFFYLMATIAIIVLVVLSVQSLSPEYQAEQQRLMSECMNSGKSQLKCEYFKRGGYRIKLQ